MAISGSLNFISASNLGSYKVGSGRRRGITQGQGANYDFIPDDFVGLNTNINEPLSSSENTLGYENQIWNSTTDFNYKGGLITHVVANTSDQPGDAGILNALLLHRNGPYGHPMWKHWRGGQHPLARYYKRNNLISIDINNPIPNTLANASTTQRYEEVTRELHSAEASQKIESLYGPDKFAIPVSRWIGANYVVENPDSSEHLNRLYNSNINLKQFYEPVLVTKYKPLTYMVGTSMVVRQSLVNEVSFFSNPEMNATLRISSGDPLTGSKPGDVPQRKLKHEQYLFFKDATGKLASAFVYSERLYPRSINAYRPYKLKRDNYEEASSMANMSSDLIPSGSKMYDKKPGKRISFWRDQQGGGAASAVSNGITRMRTDGAAKNSLFINDTVPFYGSEPEDTRYKNADTNTTVLTSSVSSYWTASAAALMNTGSRQLFDTLVGDTPWNNRVTFSMNGVVASQHNVMTGSEVDLGEIPGIQPYGAFIQLESYQPYELSALSMWPLDPRQDIYERPVYLTSSIGGRGTHIGLTPHRAGYPYFSKTGSYVSELGEDNAATKKPTVITSSIYNLNTGSAGELVYSTKPTLFFYRTGSAETNLDGYGMGKASPQYLRHTFPYNSPFYATDKIRGVDPYHNSYNAFIGNELKHLGRDYTIIPEYNASDHLEEYFTSSGEAPRIMSQMRRDIGLFEVQNYKQVVFTDNQVKLFLPTLADDTDQNPLNYSSHKFDFLEIHGAVVTSSAQNDYVKNAAIVADKPGRYRIHITNLNNLINGQTITLRATDGAERTYTAAAAEDANAREFLNDGSRTGTLSSLRNVISIRDSDYFTATYNPELAAWMQENLAGNQHPLQVYQVTAGEEAWAGDLPASGLNQLGGTNVEYKNGTNKIVSTPSELLKYKDVSDPEGSSSLFDVTETGSYGKYGASSTNHWARDRQAAKFASLFGETDTLKAFSNLMSFDNGEGFKNGKNTIPSKITFRANTIKKMRIRDGFYPVTRTVQLAAQFAEAFLHDSGPGRRILQGSPPRSHDHNPSLAVSYQSGSCYGVPNQRTQAAMIKQTFLEPLFGPGLLYNSIKSGIAVDWPMYAQDVGIINKQNVPVYYMPTDFYSGDNVTSAVSSTFNYGGAYMMGSSRCYPSILANAPSHRLPFAALYGLLDGKMNLLADRNLFLPSDFVDLDRRTAEGRSWHEGGLNNALHAGTGAIADNAGAIFKTLGKAGFNQPHYENNAKVLIYNSSMNNFLAEMMDFFLADAEKSVDMNMPAGIKFQVITPNRAAPITDVIPTLDENKKYFMEIGLKMGNHQIICEGPRRAGLAGTASTNVGLGAYGSTMRGYIYGPPIEVVAANNATARETPLAGTSFSKANQQLFFNEVTLAQNDYEMYFYYNLQDPAYQAYTPPYFYGPSSKILKYEPANTTDQYQDVWFSSLGKENTFYYESYITGNAHGDLDGLCLSLPGTSSVSRGAGSRMKVDASLEFSKAIPIYKIETGDTMGYTSFVAPWWTCPILDFSASWSAVTEFASKNAHNDAYDMPAYSNKLVSNRYHDYTTGRGLWGGYGTDPYDMAAMNSIYDKLGFNDNAARGKITKGLYLTVKDIYLGSEEENEPSATFVDEIGVDTEGFYTMGSPTSSATDTGHLTGSLCDVLEFRKAEYKLGQIASQKDVHEAIVIIPYLEEPIVFNPHNKIQVLNGHTVTVELDLDDGNKATFEQKFSEETAYGQKQLYCTREIIPGKHFLPVQDDLFNQMLSLLLTKKYIPAYKRGDTHGPAHLPKASKMSYDIDGAPNSQNFEANLNTALGTDVGNMIKQIVGDLTPHPEGSANLSYSHNLGFQLPPEFDFVHNRTVKPFQMVIMPFKHTFDKQDLVDMYQGIMPKAARFASRADEQLPVFPTRRTAVFPKPMPGAGAHRLPSWVPFMAKNHRTNRAQLQLTGLHVLEHMVKTYSGDADELSAAMKAFEESGHPLPGNSDGLDMDALGGFDNDYLVDRGLENFLTPPLMHGGNPLENDLFIKYCDEQSSIIPTWLKEEGAKGFYENLRFMVFKVKQRGNKDFKEYRSKQIHTVLNSQYINTGPNPWLVFQGGSLLENIKVKEVYGANWPYDYFSLIETAKIDIEIGVTK